MLGLIVAIALPLVGRADEQPACKRPDLLRLEIYRFTGDPINADKGKHDAFVASMRTKFLGFKKEVGLEGEAFRYLGGLELKDDPGIQPFRDWKPYFARKDRRHALQAISLGVHAMQDSEKSEEKSRYKNEFHFGPGCVYEGCWVQVDEELPPAQHVYLLQEAHLILTLYALASNAELSRCDQNIVRGLYKAGLERIKILNQNRQGFQAMTDLADHMIDRSDRYRPYETP